MTESELYHHGIKGQKWGIRRFQNEDGTLTEAGKKRDAKRIQKDLNTLDRNKAYTAPKIEELEEKSGIKAAERAAEKAASGEWESNAYDRKYDNAYNKELKKHSEDYAKYEPELTSLLMENVQKYEKPIRKLINEANEKGYTLSEKMTYRYKSKGREAVQKSFPLIFPKSNEYFSTEGTKYKVKAR